MYYIDTIEQVKAVNEQGEEYVSEYGKREKQSEDKTYPEVESSFYTKCSNVSNDLVESGKGGKHYYMDIKIVNTDGGILKKDKIGKKVETVVPVNVESDGEGKK